MPHAPNRPGRLLTSRRSLLRGAAATATLLSAPGILRASTGPRRIVFRDSGGLFSDVNKAVFYDPFNELWKGEIEITGVAGGHEPTAQIKSIVETGNYVWDGADMSISAQEVSAAAGHLVELGLDDDPAVSRVLPAFRTPHMVGTTAYATVLAYRNDAFPDGGPSGGWKDLWDTGTFRGRRAMRRHPFDSIEQALMADGVAPADVYPCDFDRAYAALDRIKSDVDVWWTGGAQSTQLLASGEVDICTLWHARAQAAIDEGAPVTISWEQGIYAYSGWVVIEGGPHVEECREFIRFCADPERQAEYARQTKTGPTNPGAYDFMDPDFAATLPTAEANISRMVPVDAAFWGENAETALERFETWIAS